MGEGERSRGRRGGQEKKKTGEERERSKEEGVGERNRKGQFCKLVLHPAREYCEKRRPLLAMGRGLRSPIFLSLANNNNKKTITETISV